MSKPGKEELTQDVIFDILSNSRRRFILSRLQERDEPIELMDLANQLAAWENDTTVEELTDKQSKRVYVSVYQTHVPKLESTGLITHDADTGLIELSNNARQIGRYMPDEQEPDTIPWYRYYVGLATVSAAFLLLVLADAPVVEQLSMPAAGLVVVTAFAILSIVNFVWDRRRNNEMDPVPVQRDGPR